MTGHAEPLKHAILQGLRATGAFGALRLANRRKILIVTYHRFSQDVVDGATPRTVFAEQVAYLRSCYTLVPLSAVKKHFTEGTPLPLRCAAITIDDGYRDAYDVALPILRWYGAPATLFLATDFIDGKDWLWTDKLRYVALETRKGDLSVTVGGSPIQAVLDGRASRLAAAGRINERLKVLPEQEKGNAIAAIAREAGVNLPVSPPAGYQPVRWAEVREMETAGVEMGSHSVSHPILPNLAADHLDRELSQSRLRLEQMLDHQVTLFCYPNGNHDSRVRNAVGRAGYQLAVTVEAGLNDQASDPLALRRIHTERDLTRFMQSTSGFESMKGRLRTLHPPRLRPARALPT